MDIEPFLLERWAQSYRSASPPIRYDLASSTGPKWTLDEVLALGGENARAAMGRLKLGYAPPNGSEDLRVAIAACHDCDPDQVVVTTGASEALSVLLCALAEPRGNAILPSPIFPAIPVMARAWGLEVRSYELRQEERFEHRADRILSAVDAATRLVLVNSPHNPTGAVIPGRTLTEVAETLAYRGIPLIVDEVYHPLYFEDAAASAAGVANTIVVGDLSKAYSLSGLRIGWIVDADAARRRKLIDARGYFTISNSVVTEFLASLALDHRDRFLERLERVARANFGALSEFIRHNSDLLGWVRPAGGTTVFPWLEHAEDAKPLCETLAARGVLTAPGECFDAPRHFRIGFGAEPSGFTEALDIISEVLEAERKS